MTENMLEDANEVVRGLLRRRLYGKIGQESIQLFESYKELVGVSPDLNGKISALFEIGTGGGLDPFLEAITRFYRGALNESLRAFLTRLPSESVKELLADVDSWLPEIGSSGDYARMIEDISNTFMLVLLFSFLCGFDCAETGCDVTLDQFREELGGKMR